MRPSRLPFVVCYLLLLTGTAHSQEAHRETEKPADWTADAACDELCKLLDTKIEGREQMKARQAKIRAWVQRVEATRTDLGARGNLHAVGLYFDQRTDDAGEKLLEWYRRHPPREEVRHSDYLGRIAFSAALRAIHSGRFDAARRYIEPGARFHTRPKFFYASLAKALRERDTEEATRFLNEVLVAALRDPELKPLEAQEVLERLYLGPRGRKAPQRSERDLAGAKPPIKTPVTPERRFGARGREFKKFEGLDLDGEKVAVDDYLGKVVLIDYWATWCGPCLREMPNVVACYEKYKDRGFDVLGVSLDRANAEPRIRKTMQRFGMTWKQVYDGGGWKASAAKLNKVRSIPATFLLDAYGKLRYTNLRGSSLEKFVAELLEERERLKPPVRIDLPPPAEKAAESESPEGKAATPKKSDES